MWSMHQFEKSETLTSEQVDALRSALQSVISSSAFADSEQCKDFLRLVVERALAGELESLGGHTVGAEVFGRPADYETSNDAAVRVRAIEVRKRLAQYYREAKQDQPVRIELTQGSDIPEF